jgi:formate hydrogenlyase subunit 3/multisubunit Na+/H+ antiporter MnhD subunit
MTMEADALLAAMMVSLTGLGDTLLPLALFLPMLALLLVFVLGGRAAGRLAIAFLTLGLVLALAVAALVLETGRPLVYDLGAWAPPLGIRLQADGAATALLALSAVILLATALYAAADFRIPPGVGETRQALSFWSLLMGVWFGLSSVFLGQDLFNLYVALEFLTFSAVPLVSLKGTAETLAAALRYLLFALMGSMLYLLGAALLYGAYGTLDLAILAARIPAEGPLPHAPAIAAGLMTAGLLAKTALFPLHLWLPPAHAGAPPAASAVLSALVVKASFFLILRLWFDAMPGLLALPGAQVLGILGALAILYGGLQALRQARLKLLVAYSTLAQLGYLFLIFPLGAVAFGPGTSAVTAGLLQVAAHASAKAAMFMAAGLMAATLGQDQIHQLGGIARRLPLTLLAFGLAGLALTGLVATSGAYLVKTWLSGAALASGQPIWPLAMQIGGWLTLAYLARVFYHALFGPVAAITPAGASLGERPETPRPSLPRQVIVLGLAIASLLLGLLPAAWLDLPSLGLRLPGGGSP